MKPTMKQTWCVIGLLALGSIACSGQTLTGPTAPTGVHMIPQAFENPSTYVVIGDSIAVGQETVAYRLPDAVDDQVFREDGQWRRADDPTDVLSNAGSFWPLTAAGLKNGTRWIATAQGSTSLHVHWQPGGASYERMRATIAASGVTTVTAFVAHLGANDTVMMPALTQAQVYADIQTLASQLATAYPGSVLVLSDVGAVWTYGDKTAETAIIRAAIEQAWATIPSVRQGPYLRDLTPDDGVHFKSDTSARIIAQRWLQALSSAGLH